MDLWMDVDANITVPLNLLPLIDDTDFKTRETGVTYNQAGLDLIWNFVTTAGVQTHTAVTPTDTGGNYDWVNIGHGMYNIEIPASGGASINNDTEGFGWFTGFATGVLPWRGPVIGFRAAALNNALIDGGDTLDVSVTEWLGTAAHAATVGGVPVVQLHNSAGTGGINAPANFEDLSITDTTGLVAVPVTQKVDLETIKTQAVTCAGAVTVGAKVGAAEVILFTGTGASALVKADGVDLGGQAVSATKAVTTDVLTDGVKVSVGTGAGQINVSSGKVPATVAVGDLANNSMTAAALAADAVAEIADGVVDEVLTAHRIKNSLADYVKRGGGGSTVTLFAGTAQAGATLTITLATDVPATANLLNQNLVIITGGTGAGQTRRIVAYSAARVCTVDRAWVVAPNATSTYEIMAAASSIMADEGTVVAATSTTIQLATSAPTGDGALDGAMVTITSGNGDGETKILSNYVGSTRTADVDSAWSVTPNSSSTYAVIPTAQSAGDSGGGTTAPTIQEIQSALLKNTSNPILTDADGHVTADVTGTVTVSGEVTLAASQPSYAPAKAGDAMALTSAYDAAKTAATQTSVDTIDTNVDTLITNITTVLARIGAWTGTGVNTILGAIKAICSKIATLPTDIGGTFDPATDSLESIREMEATIYTAIGATTTGAGAITWVYTLTSTASGNPPIADADIWVTTDLAGLNVVASGRTNQYGQVTLYLDAGTVYVWRQKSGYDFTNPDIETVVS